MVFHAPDVVGSGEEVDEGSLMDADSKILSNPIAKSQQQKIDAASKHIIRAEKGLHVIQIGDATFTSNDLHWIASYMHKLDGADLAS